MLSNLFDVCKRAENTHLRHACIDCLYFDGNEYLPCTVHPTTAPSKTDIKAFQPNNCNDWELKQ